MTITKDFYLGKYLVTKKQFSRFVAAQGASYTTEGEDGDGGWGFDGTKFKQDKKYSWRDPGYAQTDDQPVVNVTWNDAAAFLRLGKVTKRGRRCRRRRNGNTPAAAATTTPSLLHRGRRTRAWNGRRTSPVLPRSKANPFPRDELPRSASSGTGQLCVHVAGGKNSRGARSACMT